MEKQNKKAKFTSDDMSKLLDSLYQQACNGIKSVSPPLEKFAGDYLKKNPDPKIAAKKRGHPQHVVPLS